MISPTVWIVGDGIAAYAASNALRAQSIDAIFQPSTRALGPHPPILVLDETAIRLIGDVFGPHVFAGAWQLRHRNVCWGTSKRRVPQPAVSISSEALMLAIRESTQLHIECQDTECEWTLMAAPLAPRDEVEFGCRVTLTCEVGVPTGEDTSTAHVESSTQGWAFLAPIAAGRAVLQVTVPRPPSSNLEKAILAVTSECSPTVRGAGNRIETPIAILKSAPWRARPLMGKSWVGIGSAALRFDPMCGDGTAQSLRTGLLGAACAVMALRQHRPQEALDHYERRIGRSFDAHVRACSQFYTSGLFGPCWDEEKLAITQAGRAADVNDHWTPSFAFRDGALVDTEEVE